MSRRVLFIGTSHIGTLLRASRVHLEWQSCSFDFVAFGVPVWRLMLNQSDLVVRSDALQFDVRDQDSLRIILNSVDSSFDRIVGRVRGILDYPIIATDLKAVTAVVFVDCLFRFPLGLENGMSVDGRPVLLYFGQPVTLDLLVELPNVAGSVSSFTEPFYSAGPQFQLKWPTSFLNLFQIMRRAMSPDVPFFLWTFPGFQEQFMPHERAVTDLELMGRVHRYALQRSDLSVEYLQPPACCLDTFTGRVRSEFLGDGFHASDAFGLLAWQALMSSVMARL